MWAAVAPAWGDQAEMIDARAAAVTSRMLHAAGPQAGERVLELACGAGGVGMAAAERVGPAGEVVVSDAVEGMTAIAAARARGRGLANVRARVRDLEDVAEPDGAFDVVLCREGLMFATDPARAAGELRRLLRPRGRAAVAVWGARGRNPWLGLVFDAVSAHVGAPVPPPGIPGPFSLGDPGRLEGLLRDAGLEDVRVEEVEVPLVAGSPEGWWDRATALAGPLALRLAAMPPDERRSLRARAADAAHAYAVEDGSVSMPGVSLVASARAPSGGGA
jgi:enediyne biosynthesis protein CalE5